MSLTKDQTALLDIFKADTAAAASVASTAGTKSTANRSIALIEKLHAWQTEFWPLDNQAKNAERQQSLKKRRVKLNIFMEWLLEQCKVDGNGGFLHESLYLDFVSPTSGQQELQNAPSSSNLNLMVGVFVKKRVEKGELLLKFPSEMMLIASDTLSLILKIMSHECLDGSNWRPYFDVLPRSFDSLPMYWSIDQLLLLKGSSVFDEAVQDVIMSFKQYLIISQVVAQRKNLDMTIELCTWPLFRWARAIALTRQNPIKQLQADKESVKTHYGLVPFFDFFNHQPGHMSAMFDAESMMLDMTLEFDCDPEEQVFMSYGNRSNKQLFIYSGFVDKYWMSNDCFPISFSLSPKDPLFAKKEKLLDMMMLPKQGPLYLYDLHHSQSSECLQCLIIMHLDDLHLSSFISRIEKDLSVELDLVREVQMDAVFMKKVWQWLVIRLQVSLKTAQRALEKSQDMAAGLLDVRVGVLVGDLFALDIALLESLIEQVTIHLS